jgi:hypothetical protein
MAASRYVRSVGWPGAFALLGGVILFHAWFASYSHDEVEHLHAAWLISDGQLPFSDFFEQHHPTVWFLLAPLAARIRTPHTLCFVARLLNLGCLGVFMAIFVGMVRRAHPRAALGWPCLLLLSTFMFTRNMMEVRPDPLMNTFLFAGLASWSAFLDGRGARQAVAGGLLLGLAAAVLQKALVILALVGATVPILVVMHGAAPRRRELVGGGALLLVGAALPIAALYGFMASKGIAAAFWFCNYPFNQFFYLQASLHPHFSILRTLGNCFIQNPVLWLLGAFGAGARARELWRRRAVFERSDDVALTLLVVAVGYFVFLARNRFPLAQYYIILLPLLALFAVEAYQRATSPRLRRLLHGATALMPLILIPSLLIYSSYDVHDEMHRYVLAHTAPDETVFMPPANNPIYRRDAAYFWYNNALMRSAYRAYCAHARCPDDGLARDDERWRATPPRFVYISPRYPDYHPDKWGERAPGYRETPFPGLWVRK